MDFNTYRPLALRTAKMFTDQRLNLRHAALGMLTELGELATEVKRVVIYNKEMTEAMRLHCAEEAGDAQWYAPLALFAVSATDQEIADAFGTIKRESFPKVNDLADLCVAASAMAGCVGMCAVSDEPGDRLTVVQAVIGLVVFMDEAAKMLDVAPDDLRQQNIDKLRQRFPDAYSDAAAEARADKGGLPASES